MTRPDRSPWQTAGWLWTLGVLTASGLLGDRLFLLAAAAVAAVGWQEGRS